MLRALALAALLLAPAASAQQRSVTFTGGYITGDVILPITWEGRPAFLIVNGDQRWKFASIDPLPWQPKKGIVARLTPRVVAVYFQDLRPCAPGSLSFISLDDTGYGAKLGEVSPAGTMTWIASSFAEGFRLDARGTMIPDPWFAYYCGYQWCYGKCRPSVLDGPQFSALVVAFE